MNLGGKVGCLSVGYISYDVYIWCMQVVLVVGVDCLEPIRADWEDSQVPMHALFNPPDRSITDYGSVFTLI